jgi:hypothetical protein
VLLSLCYLLLHRVLPLAVWRWRSPELKELEIAVLRHELAILSADQASGDDRNRPALLGGVLRPRVVIIALPKAG